MFFQAALKRVQAALKKVVFILFSLVGHERIASNVASCRRPPTALVLGVRFVCSHAPNEATGCCGKTQKTLVL